MYETPEKCEMKWYTNRACRGADCQAYCSLNTFCQIDAAATAATVGVLSTLYLAAHHNHSFWFVRSHWKMSTTINVWISFSHPTSINNIKFAHHTQQQQYISVNHKYIEHHKYFFSVAFRLGSNDNEECMIEIEKKKDKGQRCAGILENIKGNFLCVFFSLFFRIYDFYLSFLCVCVVLGFSSFGWHSAIFNRLGGQRSFHIQIEENKQKLADARCTMATNPMPDFIIM